MSSTPNPCNCCGTGNKIGCQSITTASAEVIMLGASLHGDGCDVDGLHGAAIEIEERDLSRSAVRAHRAGCSLDQQVPALRFQGVRYVLAGRSVDFRRLRGVDVARSIGTKVE